MFHVRDRHTGDLFDRWAHLGPKRRKLLDASWAGLFRQEILPDLPVEAILPAFHARTGRPSKELYTILGALVFQQMHDLTDEEAVAQLAFSLQWHYALDLCGEGDNVKYVCPRTLFSMRQLLAQKKLDQLLFDTVTKKLTRVFSVDTSKQRLDSVHITSNMRRLGRVGILSRTITGFLSNLKRREPVLFATLPAPFEERYLSKKGQQVFSMVKPSESEKTLSSLAQDLFFLVRRFEGETAVSGMKTFSLLLRVFSEQVTVTKKDGHETAAVTEARKVSSDSLQNPSDPDATYSGHKGQGYQAQVMESYVPTQEGDEAPLRLISHVAVEPAHTSDAHAVLPAIEGAASLGLAPKEVLADSLYGSETNVEKAAEAGVELVAPVPGGEKKNKTSYLSAFTFTQAGGIALCPAGRAPVKDEAVRKHREAVFATRDCLDCPKREECPVKSVREGYGFSYDAKQVKMARRRATQKTAAFTDRYRWRSGVESTMSAFDRLTGVKHLRVRGRTAVRFAVMLKAVGVNLFRAAAYRRATRTGPEGGNRGRNGFRKGSERLHALLFMLLIGWIDRFVGEPAVIRQSAWGRRYQAA